MMTTIDQSKINVLLTKGKNATTTKEKGDALEDIISLLFESVPGITVTRRNVRNVFDTEEIDVVFWNEQDPNGFPFLPHIILVECKNWSKPVGSEHVSWFDTKLRNRGAEFGVLIAANGITGEATSITDSHSIIAAALRDRRRLIVLTIDEITTLVAVSDLIKLIKEKLCDLAVRGAVL